MCLQRRTIMSHRPKIQSSVSCLSVMSTSNIKDSQVGIQTFFALYQPDVSRQFSINCTCHKRHKQRNHTEFEATYYAADHNISIHNKEFKGYEHHELHHESEIQKDSFKWQN